MKRLDYFKRELNNILDRQLEALEKKTVAKSFSELVEEVLNKSDYDRSKLSQKVIIDKNGHKRTVWVRTFKDETKEAKKAIANLKDRVKRAKTVNDLLVIAFNNINRFEGEDGRISPIVLELKNEIDIKKTTLQGREKSAFETLISFANKKNYDDCKNLSREDIFSKYDNSPETIAIIPQKYKDYLGVKTDELKCGKAYMLDHMVHHHPTTPLALYKRIQYIFNQAKDFYLDEKNGSFALVETFGIDRKGKPKKNILLFLKEGENIVLHKTFYDTSKNLPGKLKKINLAEKARLKSGADSLTAISQSENNSDSAFRLNIQGRPDNSNINSKVDSVNNKDVNKSINPYWKAVGI